jgi:hypothetical protein
MRTAVFRLDFALDPAASGHGRVEFCALNRLEQLAELWFAAKVDRN